jgi:putative acetyltransferase
VGKGARFAPCPPVAQVSPRLGGHASLCPPYVIGIMTIRITEARWPDDRATVAALFGEYVASLAEDISFQNVDEELATLPGKYARPGGVVLIARGGAEAAGAIAYRMVEPGVCEMKRLYVRPAFRGTGLGRELANELIEDARARGYRTMLLDTLASMSSARALYRDLGFVPVEPYYDNPLPGVAYMALELFSAA